MVKRVLQALGCPAKAAEQDQSASKMSVTVDTLSEREEAARENSTALMYRLVLDEQAM